MSQKPRKLNTVRKFFDTYLWHILILVVVGITIWNIKFARVPIPAGYAKFSDYGISLVYPNDLNLWQVAIYDDGSVVQDGSKPISEHCGNVGWNSGNIDFERPGREGYYQESSVIWLDTTAPSDGVELRLYYTMQRTINLLRNQEYNISVGFSGYLNHRGYDAKYEFFNYTYGENGGDQVFVYGVLGGFYCEKSSRIIEMYYLDIYTFDPEYDRDALFDSFSFLFDYVECH